MFSEQELLVWRAPTPFLLLLTEGASYTEALMHQPYRYLTSLIFLIGTGYYFTEIQMFS